MGEFKTYRKAGITEMRPYVLGEDMYGISVRPGDIPDEGGMVARDPKNHADRWYVSEEFFKKNYEPA